VAVSFAPPAVSGTILEDQLTDKAFAVSIHSMWNDRRLTIELARGPSANLLRAYGRPASVGIVRFLEEDLAAD
jgi:hypothetical protein